MRYTIEKGNRHSWCSRCCLSHHETSINDLLSVFGCTASEIEEMCSNLERSGRSAAMELVGHGTELVYQRYDFVAERDFDRRSNSLRVKKFKTRG